MSLLPRIRRFILGFLVLGCGFAAIAAPPRYFPAPPAEPTQTAAIREARIQIAALMKDRGIPGITAAAWADGRLIWSEAFGMADLENNVPMRPDSKLRAGSVSKTLTSAAIGLLAESGRLDLDASVLRYLPDLPAQHGKVTTRLLAGHLGGIRNYIGGDDGPENMQQKHFANVRAGLAFFINDPLVCEPGTRYLYSSFGWNLASAVVEEASGVDFLTFMRERVFVPAGLTDTEADEPYLIVAKRVRFYVESGGRNTNAAFVDNSYKWAGGGFLSSAPDLAAFGGRIMDGSIVRRATFEQLIASQHTADGKATGSGMGWFVGSTEGIGLVYEAELGRAMAAAVRERTAQRWAWHTGGSIGGNAVLLVFPDAGISVALMSNKSPVGRQLLTLAAGLGASLVNVSIVPSTAVPTADAR